jgi:hypothetical protein
VGTSKTAFLNERLARHYGVPGIAGTSLSKAADAVGRAGVLTRGALMASLAHDDDTDPVVRGRFVRERLLCQSLPPAPDDVPAIPPRDGKSTQRERLVRHSADPTCASCHRLMDPLGLAFETFDAAGAERRLDAGRPIDTTGMLTDVARPASFSDAVTLQALIADSDEAGACFVREASRFVLGRAPRDTDRCATDRAEEALRAADGDLRAAFTALLTDERLYVRK